MSNNTSSLLAFVAIGVMAAVVMFKPLPTVTVQLPAGPAPIVNVSSPDVKVNVPKADPVLGAVAGPDSYFPCETHNGVQTCATKRSLTTATTTVCAIKSPNATSTLHRGSVKFSVSSTTASTVTLAKAATPFATTSILVADTSVSANAQASIVSTSTVLSTGGVTLFAPNQYFVVGMAGGVGTFSPTGSCQAVFDVL